MIAGAGFGPGIDTDAQRIVERAEGGYSEPSVYLRQIQEVLRDICVNDLPIIQMRERTISPLSCSLH
jgi:hypothetical protein